MPLLEKARVEVYIPYLPTPTYGSLLETLERELTYTFGGCTVIRALDGNYRSRAGLRIQDRINLIHTDAPLPLGESVGSLSRYTDELKRAAFEALTEEAVLVAIFQAYHVGQPRS